MIEIVQVRNSLWAADVAGKVLLLIVLVVRKHYASYPAFFFYLLTSLAHDAVVFVTYQYWGFSSSPAWPIAWTGAAIVICARALAVSEVCRHLLSRYSGVWALAWRLLLTSGVLVFLFSLLAMKKGWFSVLTIAQLGLELAIAVAIVGLLVFAKFYDVIPKQPLRSLAIGLCLYSCFSVLNNTVWERFLDQYDALWNLLGMLAFLASLLLWIMALRVPSPEPTREELLLPGSVYPSLSPQINLRLHLLNKQLSQFWNVGEPQP
jgi:hypothetical protein